MIVLNEDDSVVCLIFAKSNVHVVGIPLFEDGSDALLQVTHAVENGSYVGKLDLSYTTDQAYRFYYVSKYSDKREAYRLQLLRVGGDERCL